MLVVDEMLRGYLCSQDRVDHEAAVQPVKHSPHELARYAPADFDGQRDGPRRGAIPLAPCNPL